MTREEEEQEVFFLVTVGWRWKEGGGFMVSAMTEEEIEERIYSLLRRGAVEVNVHAA